MSSRTADDSQADEIAPEVGFLLRHWKAIASFVTTIVVMIGGSAIFYFKLTQGLEDIKTLKTSDSKQDQILAGQNQVNINQLQTNNLILDLIKEIRRERWNARPQQVYGPVPFESRRPE